MIKEKWAENELSDVDLGDERLNQRLLKITTDFAESPESPINKACGAWHEVKAAYRFFQNKNITSEKILESHKRAIAERAKNETTILAIQDTTYFNYTHHPKTKGLGILCRHNGKNKKEILSTGLVMHSTLACTTDGLPLGIVDQNIYSREILSLEKRARKKKSDYNLQLPIEEKESFRWLSSLHKTAEWFERRADSIVTIADREADIYELFHCAENINTKVLIRANHNRSVNKTSINSEISGEKLWDLMNGKKVQGNIKVKIPKSETQQERTAFCNVKFSEINILPHRNSPYLKTNKPQSIKLYAIHLKEQKSISNDPLEWMLLTNIPIMSFSHAVEKIQWYCLRWRIEVFHKILKSGFRVEDCRLEYADRLIRYLTVMSIVAWRVFWITLIGRVSPTTTPLLLFSEFELKVLFSKFCPGKMVLPHPPHIKLIVSWIAQLGGFLARKGDKDPGVIHIWRGLGKFMNLLEGVQLGRETYG